VVVLLGAVPPVVVLLSAVPPVVVLFGAVPAVVVLSAGAPVVAVCDVLAGVVDGDAPPQAASAKTVSNAATACCMRSGPIDDLIPRGQV
jgi:hypothetical protein